MLEEVLGLLEKLDKEWGSEFIHHYIRVFSDGSGSVRRSGYTDSLASFRDLEEAIEKINTLLMLEY